MKRIMILSLCALFTLGAVVGCGAAKTGDATATATEAAEATKT